MNTIYMTPDLDETEQYREDEERHFQECLEAHEDHIREVAEEVREARQNELEYDPISNYDLP